jgi:hypothetical protein
MSAAASRSLRLAQSARVRDRPGRGIAHASLKPILKVIGAQTLVTPKILKLARWIGEYYCCAPETALKSVLPEAVRHEQANWRERLHVRALPVPGELPKLPARQKEVWRILQERPELPLSRIAGAWPRPPRPRFAAWKTGAWSRSPRRFPSATPTRASTFSPANRCR